MADLLSKGSKQKSTWERIAPNEGNAFFNILDTLNTPQQMIAGGIKGAMTGAPIIESAISGAEKNTGFGDVLKTAGFDEGIGTSAAGLIGDIVLDPVNLIPIGWLGKVAKMEKVGEIGSGAYKAMKSKLPREWQMYLDFNKMKSGVLRQREAGYSKAYQAGEELKAKVFKGAEDTGTTYEKAGQYVVEKAERPDLQAIKMYDSHGITDAESAKDVAESLETMNSMKKSLGDAPNPNIDNAVTSLRDGLEDIIHREWDAKLNTPYLNDKPIDYVTHRITKEAKKVLNTGDDMTAFGKDWTARHSFQLQRKFRGMTVDDINKAAMNGRLPGYEGKIIPKFFEDDPAKILVGRLIAGEKAIADADMFTRAAMNPDFAKSVASEGVAEGLKTGRYTQLQIANSVDPRVANLKDFLSGYAFEPEIAQQLDKYYRYFINGERGWIDKFVKKYDDVQGLWKATTLFPFPAYHARNAVGNLWNNSLAGLWNPAWYGRAMKVQNASFDTMVPFIGREMKKSELYKEMADANVLSQFSAYLDLPSAQFGGKDIISRGVRGGMKIGNAVENNARIAHYMWAREEMGMNQLEAALSVKKHLFDYKDLSIFEKSILRRTMPFYAWSRNNIPLQLRYLVDKPKQFQALGDVVRETTADRIGLTEEEKKFIPEWIRANSGIPVSRDADGNPEFGLLGGWLPAADIERLTKPINLMVDQLSPLIKLMPELAFNKSLYMGRDIEVPLGEKEKFLFPFAKVPKRMSYALKNIRILAEADRFLKVVAPSMRDNKIVEDIGTWIVRTMTGLKGYPVDITKEKQYRFFDALELSREARRQIRKGREYNVQPILDMIQERMQTEPMEYIPGEGVVNK